MGVKSCPNLHDIFVNAPCYFSYSWINLGPIQVELIFKHIIRPQNSKARLYHFRTDIVYSQFHDCHLPLNLLKEVRIPDRSKILIQNKMVYGLRYASGPVLSRNRYISTSRLAFKNFELSNSWT